MSFMPVIDELFTTQKLRFPAPATHLDHGAVELQCVFSISKVLIQVQILDEHSIISKCGHAFQERCSHEFVASPYS